jgi:hypothetical protein
MGLNIGNASWSYGGFHSFRIRLAREIGVSLEQMHGFKQHGISWDTVSDPIVSFLAHSDCDGTLVAEECAGIAPRLEELIKDWEDDYDKEQATKLIAAMRECIKTGKPLEFH